jgi:hypothetical protein
MASCRSPPLTHLSGASRHKSLVRAGFACYCNQDFRCIIIIVTAQPQEFYQVCLLEARIVGDDRATCSLRNVGLLSAVVESLRLC